MEQTAVEWLLDNLISEPYSEEDFKHNKECWIKVKEMEKQQMIDFANDLLARNNKNYIAMPDLAEQYYNETYDKSTKN